jgi:hypothetical protein
MILNSKFINSRVPDKTVASCLDPELPRNCLQDRSDAGQGPPRSQLEPSRDGRDITRNKEEPVRDVMQEGQQPTELEDYQLYIIVNK